MSSLSAMKAGNEARESHEKKLLERRRAQLQAARLLEEGLLHRAQRADEPGSVRAHALPRSREVSQM